MCGSGWPKSTWSCPAQHEREKHPEQENPGVPTGIHVRPCWLRALKVQRQGLVWVDLRRKECPGGLQQLPVLTQSHSPPPHSVCCLRVRGTLEILGKPVLFPKDTHTPEGLCRYGKTISSVLGGSLHFPPSQSLQKQTAGLRSSPVRVRILGPPFYLQLRSCLQPLLAYPRPLMGTISELEQISTTSTPSHYTVGKTGQGRDNPQTQESRWGTSAK